MCVTTLSSAGARRRCKKAKHTHKHGSTSLLWPRLWKINDRPRLCSGNSLARRLMKWIMGGDVNYLYVIKRSTHFDEKMIYGRGAVTSFRASCWDFGMVIGCKKPLTHSRLPMGISLNLCCALVRERARSSLGNRVHTLHKIINLQQLRVKH